MISLPNWLTKESQMQIYKCGEKSTRIYLQRTHKLHEVAAKAVESYMKHKNPNRCLYVHHCDEIIENVLNSVKPSGEPYSDLTKKNWLDTAEKLIFACDEETATNLERIEASEKYMEQIHRFDAAYRNREKRQGCTVEDVLEKIKVYPRFSKESVLIRLYLEVPVRDDFNLALISPEDLSTADPNQNYIIPYPEERRIKVLIQKSKNVAWNKSQKPRIYTLSAELTRDIALYLSRTTPRPEQVFGPTQKLYKFVGKVLKDIGLKTGRDSINLLRGAVASSAKLTGDNNQIADAARKSLHSVATSVVYERNVVNPIAVCDSDLDIASNL